jgi:hypothetical protein
MVQYKVQTYRNGILDQDIDNLSLMEAYEIAKPPMMNPHNNRWHHVLYSTVVERITLLEIDQPLLVAWEDEMEGMDCRCNYILRMISSYQ